MSIFIMLKINLLGPHFDVYLENNRKIAFMELEIYLGRILKLRLEMSDRTLLFITNISRTNYVQD